MFQTNWTGLLLAGALTFSSAAAQVVIRVAPPRVQIERRGRAPSRNHVWVNGYQRWDGRGR